MIQKAHLRITRFCMIREIAFHCWLHLIVPTQQTISTSIKNAQVEVHLITDGMEDQKVMVERYMPHGYGQHLLEWESLAPASKLHSVLTKALFLVQLRLSWHQMCQCPCIFEQQGSRLWDFLMSLHFQIDVAMTYNTYPIKPWSWNHRYVYILEQLAQLCQRSPKAITYTQKFYKPSVSCQFALIWRSLMNRVYFCSDILYCQPSPLGLWKINVSLSRTHKRCDPRSNKQYGYH